MGANAAAGQEPLVVSIDIRLNRMCPTIRWSTSATSETSTTPVVRNESTKSASSGRPESCFIDRTDQRSLFRVFSVFAADDHVVFWAHVPDFSVFWRRSEEHTSEL